MRLRWRAVGQLVVIAASTAGLVVAIGALRANAPTTSSPTMTEVAEVSLEPRDELVTCRRRLPDVTRLESGDPEEIDSVGRVTATEVIECPDRFDRQVVTYVGEVVGDVLRREGGAWVLMNDDAYALETGPLPSSGAFAGYNSGLSVWLDEPLVEQVEHGGGPNWRGTVLRVRGQILRTDPDDGGGLTLRAFGGEVVAPARRLERPVHWPQVIAAGALAAVALGFVGWERLVARSR